MTVSEEITLWTSVARATPTLPGASEPCFLAGPQTLTEYALRYGSLK